MKRAWVFLVVLVALCQTASAEIVFSVTPLSSTITPGDTAQFQVRLASTLLSGEQVDAAEFNANAGPGNGVGGTFVSPTATVILSPLTSPVDFTSTPGQAFASNFQSGGILVPNSGILFANLFLSTIGATPGTYSLSLDQFAANSPTLAGLAASAGPAASYQIGLTAVPEPTSILTAASLGCVGMFYRRRQSVVAKSKKVTR